MNKQQLAAKIWASANKLRSKIEANEYKDYILGFIFYKYLSERELRFARENSFTEDDIKALAETDVETMQYVQEKLGYFIAYKDLFSTWLDKKRDFDVSDVRDALSAFSRLINKTHEKVFSGIFKTLETGLSKLGENSVSQTKAISSLIQLIKDIPMDGRQDYDVLGFIYEYLIGMFAANAGKKAGEFYTPHEVSLLMSEIVANHLKDRSKIEIYDPTSGSGSLLINIGRSVARHIHGTNNIKYYAQELKENTFNLTRMNLIMRGILPDNIVARNGDTLEDDWPYFEDNDPQGTYEPLYVDAVVSNPPYSQHWEPDNKEHDPRFSDFGVAPKSKADYAFLLHELYHLKQDGIMTIVLPHGVLFRGDAEGQIRKQLLESWNIDTIIGLPANIFFGTGIPTIIMVLKKSRPNSDVLIIDASNGFVKAGKSNQLRASDIKRIADTVIGRITTPGYSRVVSLDEIRANDYNLNIPRYIENNNGTEHWDMHALMFGGIPLNEIDELNAYWNALPGLRETIFKMHGHYAETAADIDEAFEKHSAIVNFRQKFTESFDGLADFLKKELLDRMTELEIAHEEETLCDDIFARLATVPLIDKYEAFQLLDDEWNKIAVDLEIIQTEGLEAANKVDPNMVIKKKEGKDEEIQEGWIGHVIPFLLVQKMLLPDDLAALSHKESDLADVVSSHEQIVEELSEEDKDKDFFDSEKNDFIPSEVKRALKEKVEDTEVLSMLRNVDSLLNREKELKKEIKEKTQALHKKTKATIEALTLPQVKMLLEAKWIQPLLDNLRKLPEKILSELKQKVQALASKYAETLPSVDTQIDETEKELAAMLDQLTGSEDDLSGIAELKKLLSGDGI